jgi:ribonuclease HI
MEAWTMTKEFVCGACREPFTLSDATLAKYPGWTPRQCPKCRRGTQPSSQQALTPSQVLEHYESGPQTGVFTDGCCEPNPGPGGWGVVKVVDGKIVEERHGHEQQTTNNRMELRALIEGYRLLRADEGTPVFTDSELCVNTITKWASAWERNGWTRGKKREEIKNLDLVKELYSLAQARPEANLQWIRGHDGARWNEYADSLSRAYQQEI